MAIVIEEQGRPAPPRIVPDRSFDLQDALILTGVLSGEIAAAVIWWPAALILASLFGFAFACLIEIGKSKRETKAKR